MPASNPRIDELRKKFDENPRRYFAPLANEYRKAGDLDQAIEICRSHLKDQPSHMSGHVVFGQALFEAKQYEEGRTIFEAALQLDPENLIALRHLGDIEKELGNPSKARGWYQRVLDADPRNEEIQIQLASLPAEPKSPTPAESSPAVEESADILGGMDWSDVAPPEAPKAPEPLAVEATTLVMEARPVPPAPSAAEEPAPLLDMRESSGGMPAIEEPQIAAQATEGFESTHIVGAHQEAEASPLAGLSGNFDHAGDEADAMPVPPIAFDSGAAAAEPMELDIPDVAAETPAAAEHRASVDNMMAWQTPRSVTPISSTPVGSGAVDPLLDDSFAEFTPAAGSPVIPPAPPASPEEQEAPTPALELPEPEPEPAPTPAPSLALDDMWATPEEPAAAIEEPADGAADAPGAFVTETMAELYVKQGLLEHAVDVYRQLVSQSPDDARLRARLNQLSGEPEAQPEPQQVTPPPASQPAYETPAITPVAAQPQVPMAPRGPSMRELLLKVAARRPGQGTGDWVAQAPAAPVYQHAEDSWQAQEAAWSETPATPVAAVEPAAPIAPSAQAPQTAGGEDLSALFGGRGVKVEDEGAALALSSAFSNGDTAPVVEGRPTRPASDEISLDRVFSDSPRRSSTETRRSQGFSFDQFFSDSSGGAPEPAAGDAAPREHDIAQFNSWLEGLKKK